MAKEKKKCKKCARWEEECKCPEKRKLGWYGLDLRGNKDDQDEEGTPVDGGADGGAMGEAVKMPRAPQDSDKDMQGISTEKKRKKLSDFKDAVAAAKKRQGDEDRKHELAKERRTKGIKFYDAKGSGYIKGGKKHYD